MLRNGVGSVGVVACCGHIFSAHYLTMFLNFLSHKQSCTYLETSEDMIPMTSYIITNNYILYLPVQS